MPTYLYQCEDGHEFEVQQSIKDEPLKECTHLVKNEDSDFNTTCLAKVKRLINFEGGILFNGPGFTPKFHK